MSRFLTLALSFSMCSAAMLRSKAATVQHAAELRDVSPELAKMNESVGMLLSGSHGPGAAEVAAQLQDLLENTLKASVLGAKKALQSELSTHYTSGFDRCDAALTSDKTVSAKQATFKAGTTKHSRCRKSESQAKTAFDACAKEEAQLKKAKVSACKVVAQLNAITKGPSVRENGETYIAFCERMESHYQGEKTKAVAAEAKCTAATEDYDSKVTSCSTLKSTWSDQKSTCDEQQDVMDAASCEVLETSKTVCKEYATCNEQATASYNLDVASVQTQEAGLKHEWTTILQMNCQLSVFTTTAKDKKSALMACINKDYTTEVNAAVTLQYPSPVPRAPKTCETASGTAGAAAYEESNYKTLPSNAPAKACVAECCPEQLFANLAGEWSVHYARWGRHHRFLNTKISCDGTYTVWNGRSSKMVLSGADFKKKCKKRTGQPQFLIPRWAGQGHKFECGWYIASRDTFRADHYVPYYWGALTQAKRVKKYDCR